MRVNSGCLLLLLRNRTLLKHAQYSDDTATLLAKQLLEGATSETCIAVVSAPSVFIQLKNLLVSFLSLQQYPSLSQHVHSSVDFRRIC